MPSEFSNLPFLRDEFHFLAFPPRQRPHLWTPTVPETCTRFSDFLMMPPPAALGVSVPPIPFSSGLRIPHFMSRLWPFQLCKNIHPLGCNPTSFFRDTIGFEPGFESLRRADFETGRRTAGSSGISCHSTMLLQEACVTFLVDCACRDNGDLR